jgi:hypothetical protein
MTEPDYILELGGREVNDTSASASAHSLRGRPWLAVQWKCCGVYSRVYRNREGTAYDGRCPRCGRPVHVNVGPGGTTARFFEAY